MGQATADLPTSPEQSPAPLNSADDLLSQLAGAEIDRMLAEAEPESVTESDPELDAAFEEAAANAPTTEAEIDELMKTAAAEEQAAAAPVPAAAPEPAPSADAYAAEVDALFAELNASPATVVEPAAEEVVQKEAPAPSPVPSMAPVQAEAHPEQQTSAAEKTALAAPPPEAEDESIYPLKRPQEKPSLLVKSLELLNFPFAACSDSLRETLGKIAILTTMNSLAVLLYLFLFKK